MLASVCNNKQRWNKDKCRCECKELIGKGVCDKRFIWSPNNCECVCEKSCDIAGYLDYENCKCRIKLVDNFYNKRWNWYLFCLLSLVFKK